MADALIFDIDGTLLDSVTLHAEAWHEAFKHFGYDVPVEAARTQIGKGGDQILPLFVPKQDLEKKGDEIKEFRADLFKKKYLPQVKPFPGVRQLFEMALARGQKIALASSARGDEIKHYERIAGIEDLIHAETSSADAERSKPHPDIFEAALQQLGPNIDRETVLVIGDSPYDAEAANRAQLRSIGVLCGGFAEETLWAAGYTAIYRDPEDLIKHYDVALAPSKAANAAQ